MQGDGLPFFEFCSAHFGGVTRDELLGLLGRMVWNRDFASVDAIVTEGVWKPALPTCARYGAVRRIVDLRLVNDSRTLANTVCQWVQQQLDMDGIVMDYLAFGWLLAEHMQIVINWFHPNGEFVAKLVPYISKPELKPQWEQNANTPVINIVEDTLADRFSMLLEKPLSHAYAIRVYDSAKQENKHLCFMNAVNHRVHRCVLNCETDESKTYQVFPANMKLQYYEASETPGMSMWLYDETKEKCIASLKLDAGTWLYFTLPTAKQGTSLTLVIAKTEEESVELMKQIKI